MPAPRLIGTKKIWDRVELDEAFEELPRQFEEIQSMPWTASNTLISLSIGTVKKEHYREPGGRAALRGPVGSPEFCEDYLKASTGATVAKPPSRNVSRGSMTQIVSQYYASAEYKNNLGEVTRKRRKTILTDFLNKYGDTKITDWEVRHIRKLRDENASTPGSASDVIKALRGVFRFALENDIISYNPMRDVPLLKGSSEGFKEWTIFDIEKYESVWPIGTKERLALALLVYTGQRRSDIIMCWAVSMRRMAGSTLRSTRTVNVSRSICRSYTNCLGCVRSST